MHSKIMFCFYPFSSKNSVLFALHTGFLSLGQAFLHIAIFCASQANVVRKLSNRHKVRRFDRMSRKRDEVYSRDSAARIELVRQLQLEHCYLPKTFAQCEGVFAVWQIAVSLISYKFMPQNTSIHHFLFFLYKKE